MRANIERSLAFGVLFLGASPGPAQTPPTDLARQHLESGIQFYQQGRYKQALNDFQIIVTSMSSTEYADDALLRIGRYYLEVEEEFDQARQNFDSILRAYPTGDQAPGAYYYLGEVLLRSDRTGQGIDDALANFQRVFLYPDNPWIPAALYSTGIALERQGKFEEAMDAYFQAVVEHPNSEWSAGAQLGVGRSYVRLGQPIEAMAQLQEVRNSYPDTEEAENALDWLTLLFRFYAGPSMGEPIRFRRDPSFSLSMSDRLKDVIAVRVSAAGIHVLERGRKRVLTFGDEGQLGRTQQTVDPYGLVVDPRGELIVANEKGVLVGGQPVLFAVPAEKGPEPLEKIRAAVRDRLGEFYVYDDNQKKVLRFDSKGTLVGPFPDSTPREVLAMDLDLVGNLVLLEKKDREVHVYSPTGQRLSRIEPKKAPWQLKKPVDIAVDPAGYLYVLDEDLAQIAVFDASFQFVSLLSTNQLGSVLEKPLALDVGASGDLYVFDDKEKSLVRLH